MEEMTKLFFDKISSYNIFNNLYPGVIFCYSLKIMFDRNIIQDSWIENIIMFYFVGMILSRIGSIIIEPTMKKIKLKGKTVMHFVPYVDYEKACKVDPMVAVLSETNNIYRSLLTCFLCTLLFKVYNDIIKLCFAGNEPSFIKANWEWIILIFLIVLFTFSYIKQTTYVGERVISIIDKTEHRECDINKEKISNDDSSQAAKAKDIKFKERL